MSLFGLLKRPNVARPVMRELPAEPGAPVDEPALTMPPTPDDVLHMLFQAMVSGDRWHVDQLCRDHRDTIETHAQEWKRVPAALGGNMAAADWYAHGIDLLMAQVRVSSLATAV